MSAEHVRWNTADIHSSTRISGYNLSKSYEITSCSKWIFFKGKVWTLYESNALIALLSAKRWSHDIGLSTIYRSNRYNTQSSVNGVFLLQQLCEYKNKLVYTVMFSNLYTNMHINPKKHYWRVPTEKLFSIHVLRSGPCILYILSTKYS